VSHPGVELDRDPVFIAEAQIRSSLVGWITFTLSLSSGRLVCVSILCGAKNSLRCNDEQFLDVFYFDDREGIFLHTAIREINDFSGEEIIAVQVDQDSDGVRVVDIADFEMDALIDPAHASHLYPSR
jgi:hypothetical protein